MKIERVKLLASAAGVALLAACGGGSEDTSGTVDTVDTGGLIPDGVAEDGDLGDEFLARVESLAALVETSLSLNSEGLPTTGGANFTGTGLVVDQDIPQNVTDIGGVAGFALVTTQATASVNFETGIISAKQFGFIDVQDNPVDGEIDYSGVLVSGRTGAEATAIGDVDGTAISATGAGTGTGVGTGMAVFSDSGGGNITTGFFFDEGDGGTYDGRNLAGAFAVD